MKKNLPDNDFDDLIRKRYRNYTIKPDSELWRNINGRQNEKAEIKGRLHNNLRIKIATIAAACVLVAIFFGYHILTKDSVHPKTASVTPESKRPNTQKYIEQKSKKNTDTKSDIRFNMTETEINRSPAASRSSASINSGIKTSEKNKLKQRPENKMIAGRVPERTRTAPGNINSAKSVLPLIMEQTYTSNIRENQAETNMPSDYKPGTINDSNHSLPMLMIRPIETGELPHSEYLALSGGIDRRLSASGMPSEERISTNQHRFFVESFFSPEFSYRVLGVNSKNIKTDYQKAYFNSRERTAFTFSTGFLAGMRCSDRIVFRTGLYLSQYALKFRTESVNVLYNSNTGYYLYTSSGEAGLTIHSSDTISPNSFVNSSLRINFINIPVGMEYKLSKQFSIHASLLFDYIFLQSLTWQSADFNGDQSQSSRISGLNTINLSMIAGITYQYSISQDFALIISPEAKVQLTSLNANAPVNSYPYAFGLHGGVRFYF